MHPEVTYNTGCGASEPLPWRTERAKETTVKKKKKKILMWIWVIPPKILVVLGLSVIAIKKWVILMWIWVMKFGSK
jgi:hypothetical protein